MQLFVERATTPGAVFVAVRLPEGDFVIGRAPGCDLVLPSKRLSRRHVQVTRSGDRVAFTDLARSNGTQLNGSAATGGALAPGDRLTVGDLVLTLHPDGAEAPLPTGDREGRPFDWAPLRAFMETLRASSDPRTLLERLLAGTVQLLGVERGFVLLKEGASDELVPVAAHGAPDPKELVAVSSTVYRRVLQTGRPVFVPDSLQDPDYRQAPSLAAGPAGRCIACCALEAAGERFGVIYADRATPAGRSGGDVLSALEVLAGLASELLAAQSTRELLLAARGRLEAMARLAAGDEEPMMGEGPAADELRDLIQAAAAQDVSVLVTGATGTGKELVAHQIHLRSRRRAGPFIPVSCAALPLDTIEAELFGAERGAFTGATERRAGRFELAHGGTLFLDEVGEVPVELQVKLLRVLQERTVTRLGGTRALPLDFRLVCATNRDLGRAVDEGRLREDFFYRINVFRIHLRPLAERPEDVLPLARRFLSAFARRNGRRLDGFTPEAEAALRAYGWPGNVRELRNAVERATVVERGQLVGAASLPLGAQAGDGRSPLPFVDVPGVYEAAQELFERTFIERCFKRHRGSITAMSRESGLGRATIYRWLRRFGLGA